MSGSPLAILFFILSTSVLSCLPSESPNLADKDTPPGQNGKKKKGFILSSSGEDYQVKKMALLGDSIGVGFLSDTMFGSMPPKQSPIFGLVNAALSGAMSNPHQTLMRIGEIYKDKHLSPWISTSKECEAHSCLLSLSNDNAVNLATLGAEISQVTGDQLPRVKDDTDYIVVEVGANDFCQHGFNKESFLGKYRKLVKALSARAAKPVVLFVPIPNIPELFSITANSTAFTMNLFIPIPVKCSDIRDGGFLGRENAFCPRLGKGANLNEEATNWQTLNESLEKIISEEKNPKLVFAKSLMAQKMTKNLLAADCFHPSKNAIKVMAEQTWLAVKDLLISKGEARDEE